MRIWAPVTLVCSGVLGLFLGCTGDGGGQNCTAGTQFCLCFQGTCQVGLVCIDNYCISPNDAETSGNPGDGDGDSGDGDGDSGDGDGDGGPGDGDGDGDGDGGPGDGDGGPGDGDGDGDPGLDSDNDGVSDGQDNCPIDHNPNQLDFDGNGSGNVCDVLTFNTVAGSLTSSLDLDGGFGSCSSELPWTVLDGQVRVQLDDNASLAYFEITELVFETTYGVCELGFVTEFDFWGPMMVTDAPFPVSMAHSMAAHEAGTINGSSNASHAIQFSAEGIVWIQGQDNGPEALMLDGTLPSFSASISGGGSSGTLSWNSANAIIVSDQFPVTVPLPFALDYDISGLSGSLNLSP